MAAQSRGKWSFRGCACCEETAAPARLALSRRSVLGGAAGLALGGLVPSSGSAETPTKASLVDVHHHLAPPAYIADLKKRKLGLPQTLEWTPEKSLADMDAAGVATAFLSITVPGVWFDDEDAATIALARACNEYGAKLAGDGSRRFGTFAILPLPHVDASLREIDYALDTLKADAALGRKTGVPLNHPVLYFDGATNGVNHAAKLDEDAVTRPLDHAPVMYSDGRIDQIASERP